MQQFVLALFKLRGGASRGRFVGLSVCWSVGLSVCLSLENFDNFWHWGFLSQLNIKSDLFLSWEVASVQKEVGEDGEGGGGDGEEEEGRRRSGGGVGEGKEGEMEKEEENSNSLVCYYSKRSLSHMSLVIGRWLRHCANWTKTTFKAKTCSHNTLTV